jgi:crossover junction endodeoxyribonuclease RuvC
VVVAIEEVHSMPNQGVSSTFSFGRSYGIMIGVCAVLGIPYVLVRPQRWKAVYEPLQGLQGDIAKDAARQLATELYPNLKILFEKRKDDGRAEAILIANYQSTHGQTEQAKGGKS